MTGPEFANAHGNDSSTWTAADIEAEQNLAAIDAHTRRLSNPFEQRLYDAGQQVYARITDPNQAACMNAHYQAS